MLNLFIDKNNLDEVVFEHRNKAYGAYQIRKQYDERVVKAMMIVFGSFVVAGIAGFVFTPEKVRVLKAVVQNPAQDVIDIVEVVLPETNSANTAASTAAAAAAAPTDNTVYQIAPDKRVNAPVPTVTPTPNLAPTPGIATSGTGLPDPRQLIGPSTGSAGGTGGSTASPMTTFAEFMPEFNNGEGDLYAYLNKNIVYPEIALKMGISGRVMVRFDVNDKGEVSNVVVERGIGFGCDEEAKRVVEQMPKWKPGRQNGKAVAVRMRLPISFTIQ